MTVTSIRKIRRMNDLTQEEMAKTLNMAPSTYYQKEQGRLAWQLKDFILIKRHYGIPIEEIDEFIEFEKTVVDQHFNK
ncbi:helix-turn-helix domain-containing protein [Erysipelothrix anatis]|uniref:helix-turn-helix domain-containing protein n=1 Tax=Erysipelothrix anatis TaxID=2683713 RepID=UPI0013598493|nr:helix-turn-helix transcriptional regulator [Erysipelothrix anatis]